MLSQRALQTSVRRLAAHQTSRTGFSRLVAPAAVALNTRFIQRRQAATTSSESPNDILAKQRLHRPVSPHLSIYRPQITWIASSLNRITGSVLSGGIYIFGTAYLLAPMFGWNLSSASMAAAFAAWPVALKVFTKALIAFPFTFHSFNGIRHLVWDFGLQFKNKEVQVTGWTVVGLTTISSLWLALMY